MMETAAKSVPVRISPPRTVVLIERKRQNVGAGGGGGLWIVSCDMVFLFMMYQVSA